MAYVRHASLTKVPVLPVPDRGPVYRPRLIRASRGWVRLVHRVLGCPGSANQDLCPTCPQVSETGVSVD